LHANKRAMTLNLKTLAGLPSSSASPPRPMSWSRISGQSEKRLGIDYETSRDQPGIVYGSISGSAGRPYQSAGLDQIAQGMAG